MKIESPQQPIWYYVFVIEIVPDVECTADETTIRIGSKRNEGLSSKVSDSAVRSKK
jgi:hypothetical protein